MTDKKKPARREVDRRFKWAHGHDPNDDDAWEGSGWEYAKVLPGDSRPEGPPVKGTGGQDAGFSCVSNTPCTHPMKIVQAFEAREILQYLEQPDLVIPKVEDRVVLLACTGAITHYVQWRESMLPIKTRLGL